MSPDLVVLGNLLLDDLVFPDGRTRMAEPGGATVYASLGANLWGLGVGVVSLRGTDYPVWALEALAERGVDLTGVHELGGPGVRTWLLYEEGPRQIVHRVGRPSHAEVSPGADRIPPAWQRARAFHLAPMPLEVQRDVVTALSHRDGVLISLDPHVPLRAETMAAWGDVLAQVDVLFLGEDEMQLDHAREDPHAALRRLANERLRLVLFKRGARGGLAYDAREDRFHQWAPRAEQVVDPTGAGDALAGGFLAGWLNGEPLERALERGVVSASFAIADWGPTGLLDATAVEARTRLREWCG